MKGGTLKVICKDELLLGTNSYLLPGVLGEKDLFPMYLTQSICGLSARRNLVQKIPDVQCRRHVRKSEAGSSPRMFAGSQSGTQLAAIKFQWKRIINKYKQNKNKHREIG